MKTIFIRLRDRHNFKLNFFKVRNGALLVSYFTGKSVDLAFCDKKVLIYALKEGGYGIDEVDNNYCIGKDRLNAKTFNDFSEIGHF